MSDWQAWRSAQEACLREVHGAWVRQVRCSMASMADGLSACDLDVLRACPEATVAAAQELVAQGWQHPGVLDKGEVLERVQPVESREKAETVWTNISIYGQSKGHIYTGIELNGFATYKLQTAGNRLVALARAQVSAFVGWRRLRSVAA